MSISAQEIKRQILMESDKSGIKKRALQNMDKGGVNEGDIIELGKRLENLTKQPGWYDIEAYMLKSMNLVGLAFAEGDSQILKGKTQAYIMVMQYVDQMIKLKDEILSRENSES